MNKVKNIISFFSNLLNLIKINIKIIIIFVLLLFLIIIGRQIYIYTNDKQILALSLHYIEAKNSDSQSEFVEKMNLMTNEKGFYSLMASLELINIKIENNKFKESYDDYLNLLNKKNINSVYKTLISINGSYNLLNKISSNDILNLL